MIVVDNGDAIRGLGSAASVLDYTINGYVGTAATQLADGQLGSSEADLYLSAADAIVVLSIVVVNTDTSARTVDLFLKPSGGTSRRIIPKACSLAAGYSLHTDGVTVSIMTTTGQIVQTYSAHKDSHDPQDGADPLDTAIAGAIEPDDSAAIGTSHSLSRADHKHSIVAAAPGDVAPDASAAEGSAVSFARSDHTHGFATSTPADIAAANAEGDGASFVRNNHVHNHPAALHKTGGGVPLKVPRTYVWFISGTVATGTEQGPTFRMKRATVIEDIELHVKTAPTGAALIVDINEAGSTVFSTKPEIDIDGTVEDDNHVFSDTALAAAAELTMDVDQVGSTIAGADLAVLLHCYEYVF